MSLYEYICNKCKFKTSKKERNIGQEILTGIIEIKEWHQGKKKLKTKVLKSEEDE